VVHGTYNAGDGDLVFLAILSPAVFEGPALVDMSGEAPWASLRSGTCAFRVLIAPPGEQNRCGSRWNQQGPSLTALTLSATVAGNRPRHPLCPAVGLNFKKPIK